MSTLKKNFLIKIRYLLKCININILFKTKINLLRVLTTYYILLTIILYDLSNNK